MDNENKGMSLFSKVLGVNMIAALIYMGMHNVQDAEALALLHAVIAIISGFFMLFADKTRKAGGAMLLSGIVIFIIGFSICASNFHLH